GGVGPNFADQYWVHGGDIKSIFKTIKYGVPAKGMISWQSQLKPADMQAVASYIYQFEGTNPPYAKAPQGEIFIREGSGESLPDSINVEAVDSTLQTQLIK
ncbi:MAG: cytochrome c, partial [Chitinophagales bacterium]